jgi:hypothetical protein
MRISGTKALVLVAIVGGAGLAAGTVGTVRATPPTGNLVATPLLRATVSDRIEVDKNGISLETNKPVDTVLVHNVAQPGFASGWHMHTGPVFISIKSGSATLYTKSCRGRTFSAGQVFVEPPMQPVNVTNEGVVPVDFYTTQLIPAGSATRIDAADPCPARGHK